MTPSRRARPTPEPPACRRARRASRCRVAGVALAALTLLSAATAPSCAYVRDRARDFAKIAEVEGGIATGFNVHGGLSHVLEFGAGWYAGRLWGLREGAFVDLNEERTEFGIPLLYLHEVNQRVNGGSMVGRARVRPLDAGYERYPLQWFSGQLVDRDPLDFHFGGNVVFLGVHLSLRFYAMADFLAGIFTVDLRGNDLAGVTTDDLLLDLHSPDALERRRAVELLQDLTGKRWPEYQTPTRRDLFNREERDAVETIDRDVRGGAADPAAVQRAMEPVSVTTVLEYVPPPVEAAPARQR